MKRKLIPLMLLPLLALTSCGEITTKPTNYEDPLVVLLEGNKKVDVYNNINKIIYDAKLDGGTVAKDVLNDVLLQFAESIFGKYEELKAVTAENADENAVQTFITNHKVYWSLDAEGKRVLNDLANEKIRVKLQAQRIEERIANKFFDAIKGSFTRDGYFYESDYQMSLIATLKNVKKPTELGTGLLIPPEFEGKDVFKEHTFINDEGVEVTTSLLNRANYEDAENGIDYLRKDVVNEIYRELLVEQYLFDSNYSAISRAYAREVNIVTITNRDDAEMAANNLMNAYVDTHINGTKNDAKVGLETISQAWRGYNLSTEAEALAKKAFTATGEEDPIAYVDGGYNVENVAPYYNGTSYGSLVKKLEKVKTDSKLTDTTIESEFTNNGAHTVNEGFKDKLITVQQENYLTKGWHLRNGGLSSLNEKIRTRLFNIGVANALDKKEYPDRFDANEDYNNHPEGENPYVAKIHGRYFLKPATTEKPSDEKTKTRDMLWFDEASNSFTIVEIKNAISSAKLSKYGDDNYIKRGTEQGLTAEESFINMENIAHSVAYELAKGDSYRSLSTKHWLKAAKIAYNDDDIEKYFEENYPELFEEEE